MFGQYKNWYNCLMEYPDEINYDISKYTEGIDPTIIEMVRLAERVKIFSKIRNLIYEKEYEKDYDSADILGWAYDKLAD
jgi:hypothetical protein